jgi:protein-disulfide isomerase/uncharacterized membrane protein
MSKRRARRQDSSPTINARAAWIGVVIAIIGGALALNASNTTVGIEAGGIQEPSACTLGSVIDCDAAHASQYAMILGVPVAWLGLLFYVIAGACLAFGGGSRKKGLPAAAVSVALGLSILSIAYSVLKAFHLVDLGVLCLVCLGMYAANIGIFVAALKALGLGFGRLPGFLGNYFKASAGNGAAVNALGFAPRTLAFAGIVAAVFAVGIITMRGHVSSQTNVSPQQIETAVNAHFRQAPARIELPDDVPVKGEAGAPVEIVEFSDFQCPACKVASGILRAIVYEFDDEVAFRYVNYPLDTNFNDSLSTQIHPLAGPAAMAAYCAGEQGKFWEYHDGLFEDQPSISPSMMSRLARTLDLDEGQFAECLASPESRQKVRADVAFGNELDVRRTPTIIINGRPVNNWNSLPVLRAIIDEELDRLQ